MGALRVPEPADIQADLKYCLYCIYNNAEGGSGNLSLYLKHMMRIQNTLRDCLAVKATSVTPNSLFSIFEANIREFMGGIRDKLVEEIRELIMQKPLERRYSLDDYFLVDRVFSKSWHSNELFQHCSKYMSDLRQYEQVKTELRQRIWREMRKNNETIIALEDRPELFQRVMNLVIRFYSRCQEAVVAIEEMWVYLVEALFH